MKALWTSIPSRFKGAKVALLWASFEGGPYCRRKLESKWQTLTGTQKWCNKMKSKVSVSFLNYLVVIIAKKKISGYQEPLPYFESS